MCPGCSIVISTQVKKAISQPGFFDMVDLTLLPYGNAVKEGSEVKCQHGPVECLGNKLEACGLKETKIDNYN